jgi:hypothetical protein
MIRTLDAVFDGEVLRPEEPLELQPNTRVRITIEAPITQETATPHSLIQPNRLISKAHRIGQRG